MILGRQFVHSKIDVISADRSCKIYVRDDSMIEITVEHQSYVDSSRLSEIAIHRRQCRYINESNLSHYPNYYTEFLCDISCRIDMAIELCNCIPFLYVTGKYLGWGRRRLQ